MVFLLCYELREQAIVCLVCNGKGKDKNTHTHLDSPDNW